MTHRMFITNLLRRGKFLLFFFLIPLVSCSLPPEKKMTLTQLDSNIGKYNIDADMNDLLEKLNERGEAVVLATHYGILVYLQIFYTSGGIVTRSFDINEYTFYMD